ncbi:hypothetical protein PHSY_004404 [Pseudozyma hubeiensis SY62]|uniref:Uncharacterized protein n=1 Tax=Pseudozyma hubeiensis (strain SY62) TaxID=1305764 RepID=R9PFJ0_PSEHS|nr:hypothetical protein PHSY_004404 [Pseudozyma hubeiensis SY62]GAC96820.1 hypothetical protein PHSY_004404 [Pseudozyma hubeiensis SY62]
MSTEVAASAVKKEEQDAVASSSNSTNHLPAYLPSTTSKPDELPRAYLNGTQDMLSLFGLMPIYDRAVRPYNPDTIKVETEASSSTIALAGKGPSGTAAAAGPSSAVQAGATGYAATGAATAHSATQGATPSTSQQGVSQTSATPRPNTGSGPAAAPTTGLASHPSHGASSTGRISTPALQLNGGPPTFSLHTDSSAILAASPGQIAAAASAAPPARKPTKPPGTYAHYVDDLAGRVRPPRKSARAAKEAKGTSLVSILFKPEYTPQRIVPFDRETMKSAFSVEPGVVEEIDQALLEPDEEETVKPKKKKKKLKQEQQQQPRAGNQAGSVPPSDARTPYRR